MKKLLTLALAAGLAAIATAENFRIDISGQSNQVGLVVKQMDDGITGTQAEWLGDKKDQRLIFCGPVAGKWEKKSFSFLAKKDGKISICLMGYENRADAPLIAYDDIKVNGQPLINAALKPPLKKLPHGAAGAKQNSPRTAAPPRAKILSWPITTTRRFRTSPSKPESLSLSPFRRKQRTDS